MAFRIFFSFFLSNLKRRKTHFPGREFDFIFALEQTEIGRSNAFECPENVSEVLRSN
jgi:hypothetical protein